MVASEGYGTILPHLSGAAAPTRQVIAAYAVEGVEHIIEIGGAGLPITGFLRRTPRSITVIDPKIEPLSAEELGGEPCRVRHIACKIQQAKLEPVMGALAVVFIGLSLKPWGDQASIPDSLVDLCVAASVVVIERPKSLRRSARQLPELIRRSRLRELWSVDLVLHDPAITGSGHERRRLMVMKSERAA